MNSPATMLPPRLQALAVLAHAHRVQGDAARSALLFGAIELLHPQDPAVLRGLAAAELAAGRPAPALAALERSLLLPAVPVDGAFHLLRAQALLALGRRDEAQGAMQAALALRGGPEVVA